MWLSGYLIAQNRSRSRICGAQRTATENYWNGPVIFRQQKEHQGG